MLLFYMWSSISKLDRSLILLFVQNYLLVLWNSHDNFGVGLYSKTWVLPMAHTLLVCLQPSSSPLVIRGTDMMRSCILVLSTCLCQSLVSLLLYHARTYSKCFFQLSTETVNLSKQKVLGSILADRYQHMSSYSWNFKHNMPYSIPGSSTTSSF